MKGKIALLAVTSVVLVAGCNRGGTADNMAAANAANSETTNAVATSNSAAAAGGAVDQAFVTGHWGVGGDCSRTLTFNADGTATATGENDPVRWTLEGNIITTVEGDNPPERANVTRNGDRMVVTPEGNQTMELTRCASPATAEPDGDATPSN